jgi:hypothetical protein
MASLKTKIFRALLILTSAVIVYFIGSNSLTEQNANNLSLYWGIFGSFLLLHIFTCWNAMKEKFEEKATDEYETLWHASFEDNELENTDGVGVITSYIFTLYTAPVLTVSYALPYIYQVGGFLTALSNLFGLIILIIFGCFVFWITSLIIRLVITYKEVFIVAWFIIWFLGFYFQWLPYRPYPYP